jgi:DNA-binding MarR family transcriptional regulator
MATFSLCDSAFSALRKIARAVSVHSRESAKEHGLTTPQISVLKEVASAGKIAVSRIATLTHLSHATVSGILDRLERSGLVERIRDHADRRCVNVQLTSAGREVVANTPPLLGQDFITAFGALPEWEQTLLLGSLQKIAAMMTPAEAELAKRSLSDVGSRVSEDATQRGATQRE